MEWRWRNSGQSKATGLALGHPLPLSLWPRRWRRKCAQRPNYRKARFPSLPPEAVTLLIGHRRIDDGLSQPDPTELILSDITQAHSRLPQMEPCS